MSVTSTDSVEKEARRILNRLRRAVEKAEREAEGLEGALRSVEAEDFPAGEYEEMRAELTAILDFIDAEAERLQEKILHAGGLEPGRVRRSSS